MKLIKQIFKEINNDIFNGALDMPTFEYIHDGAHFGWYIEINGEHIININPVYGIDYNYIFGTVAHEMCHQADWTFHKKTWKKVLTHKGKWAKMAREIEKFYNLERGTV